MLNKQKKTNQIENRINKFEILNDQKQNELYVYVLGMWRGMERSTRELCHQTENKTLTLLLAYTSRLSDRIKSHFHHHQHHHPNKRSKCRVRQCVYRSCMLRVFCILCVTLLHC